jgi:hypothetical protein
MDALGPGERLNPRLVKVNFSIYLKLIFELFIFIELQLSIIKCY